MSTKICPNCNVEVLAIANLCKHCFHDFHYVAPKKQSPLWTLLFLAVGTSFVSAAVFAHIYGQQKVVNISIDKDNKSLVFTTKYPDRTEAKQVAWKDISTVEYIKNTRPAPFQVWVVTVSGDRYAFAEGSVMLDVEARRLAETIGKPVTEKDEYEGTRRDQSGTP